MVDTVLRPLAGLLLCGVFVALILSLPTVIRHARTWIGQAREGNLPAPVLHLIRHREDKHVGGAEENRKAS